MKKLLLIIFLLTAASLYAQTLKLGMLTPVPPRDEDRLYNLGSYLHDKLKDGGYQNFAVYTSHGTDINRFMRLIKSDGIDIVISDYYQSAVIARQEGFTPVFAARKNGSLYESSVVFTLKDSGIYRLTDLKGRKTALTYNSSATGSWLPLKMMKKAGLNIYQSGSSSKTDGRTTVFFYAGSEQDAALAVYLRKAETGAMSEYAFNNLVPDIYKPSLRVIGRSESVYALFVMLNNTMTSKQKEAVAQALKEMPDDAKGKKILEDLSIDGLYPVGFDWETLFSFVLK